MERNDVLPLLLGSEDALRQLLVVEPDLLGDQLACARAIHLALSDSARNDAVALLDARRVFDRDAAAVCVGQASEAAALCAPPLLLLPAAQPPECGAIFAPAVPEDGACVSDADCLAIDEQPATCFSNDGPDGDAGFDVSLTGTCAPVPGLGEACAFEGGVCQAGAFCSPVGLCLPLAGEGAPCGEQPCDVGLRCAGVCVAQRPSGQDPEANGCSVDEDCLSGLCAPVAVETPDGPVVVSICADPPAIDPQQIRFDFCLDDRANATIGDLLPEE